MRKEERLLALKPKRGYEVVKRIGDFTLSLITIVLLSPVFLIISILIFLDDPKGSPFFVQTRVGKNGKLFKMVKFRSMVVDAEKQLEKLRKYNEKDGPVFKIKDDPRITKIGHFIRKTSIDELPQLYNIFLGSMSIVGPRPALPKEVEQYTSYQKQRLLVKPGLTCFWQVNAKRDEISFEEWMDSDIEYIKQRSAMLDLKLIFKTIKVVLTGQGE